ncbi:MAG: DUF2961 domain-containing protein [Planctomycetes bacterium]|nr:DUF2961 domain-containing protein [Planctomycetota bacterium]
MDGRQAGVAVFGWIFAHCVAVAACAGQDVGGLADLTRVRDGTSARASSAPADRSSNRDNRWIEPGATTVLADLQGPGIVQHIWMTFAAPEPSWLGRDGSAHHGELVLRMFWDGAEAPAVEAPVGDFFAAGFGRRAAVRSLPVQVEGGDAYNCFWQMPFFRSARIEIENQSARPFNAFYFHVDWVRVPELPTDTAYFCAQYRQEFPVRSGRDYLVLDAEGRGHYVGTVLSVRSRSPEWFGEGDDKFYIDGEKTPSVWGTGTEDYVLNAWGMGTSTFPCFGVSILDGEWGMVGWSTTVYRWHIADPVRFTKSLRVTLENAGWISTDELAEGEPRGFVERNDDYATVAFWYQVGQPKRFAALPAVDERALPDLDVVFEGRTLREGAAVEGGKLSLQKGWRWTGDGQLFFTNAIGDGAWFEARFAVANEELRQLTLRATHSYDFGRYRILLDGEEVRAEQDFYAEDVELREHDLGQRRLPVGEHVLRFECIGRNAASRGALLGIDSVRLRQRWQVERRRPARDAE